MLQKTKHRWLLLTLSIVVLTALTLFGRHRTRPDNQQPLSWPTTEEIERTLDLNARRHDAVSLETMTNEYISKSKHFTMKPNEIDLLTDRRSPCWSRGGRTRCLPSFYIAGFAKCATTTLWEFVNIHKQVANACTKEPNFWALFRFKPWRQTFDQYLNCFRTVASDKNKDKITGDASPLYAVNNMLMKEQAEWPQEMATPLSSQTSEALLNDQILPLNLIHQYTPNAKYIISIRDPVDRTYSYYYYLRRYYSEKRGSLPSFIRSHTTPSDFHERVVNKLTAFTSCLARGDLRSCTHEKQFRGIVNQVELSFYGVYLHELLRVIPRENFLFVNQHELSSNPRRVMEKVFRFLELDHDESALRQIEKGTRANKARVKPQPMLPETRRLLEEAYAPFNRQLARMLNDTSFLYGYS